MTTVLSRRRFTGSALALAAWATASRSAPAPSAARAPGFRFALNAATIRGQKLPLPEQLRAAAAAGYDGYEPWTSDLLAFRDGGGSLKDLGRECADRGLRIISAIGFARWIVDDDAERAKGVEQLRIEMSALAEMGGTHIAAPPSGATKPDVKLDLDRAAERYRAILEIGRGIGVIPQIEAWGASANLSRLAEAAYVAAQAGHPDACVLADAYHMYKGGSVPASLRLLSPRALHCFHLNDYPAQPPRETIKDSDRIWPGDGVAPLGEILGALAAIGNATWLSLEVFNAEYWKLPADEACRTGLAKMKGVVAAATS
jgi:sugar phosphate isomerase/epimerase